MERRDEVDDLEQALRQQSSSVRVGRTDSLARMPWRLAWTHDDGAFELWGRMGRRLAVVDDHLVRRGRRNIATDDVREVRIELSRGWIRRGVQLRLVNGQKLVVARRRDLTHFIDMTHDGLDLLFEAGWVLGLGESLSSALDVPLDRSEWDR